MAKTRQFEWQIDAARNGSAAVSAARLERSSPKPDHLSFVMPGLYRDGRVKPGHDE
jgi:hypothetical protein